MVILHVCNERNVYLTSSLDVQLREQNSLHTSLSDYD